MPSRQSADTSVSPMCDVMIPIAHGDVLPIAQANPMSTPLMRLLFSGKRSCPSATPIGFAMFKSEPLAIMNTIRMGTETLGSRMKV